MIWSRQALQEGLAQLLALAAKETLPMVAEVGWAQLEQEDGQGPGWPHPHCPQRAHCHPPHRRRQDHLLQSIQSFQPGNDKNQEP